MGLFDFLFGKPAPKKKTRGPSRSAAERAKLEEVRFLQQLKDTNPQLYQEMMLKRLGLSVDQKDELAQLQGTVKKLREMGLIKSANDIDAGAGAWVKDALAGLGILLQGIQGQPPRGLAPIGGQEDPQAAPAPAVRPVSPPAPAQPASLPTPKPQEDPMISQYLISQLHGKTPQQAAAWLAAQPYPQAQQLVTQLCQLPDQQIIPFLTQLGQQAPGWGEAVAWLQGQGEIWVRSTVQELRRLTGQGSISGSSGL